ncbi:Fe-S cluster assembly ATPase SufC [Candidatus Woesearchaeota archaeon]|nr:Fe-S cluster assembly ATPase SufC [Candidatus Woesearchaeota archaeon]
MEYDLTIENLEVSVEGKKILKGISLKIKKGETAVLMGPNGSGKSTLAYTIMGHPKYKIDSGRIMYKGKDIAEIKPNERAKLGIFLSFQYPSEISGVTLSDFLRIAYSAVKTTKISIMNFKKLLKEQMKLLKLDDTFADRSLNEGFSGGEKKKAEILQLALLEPSLALLDETDSGLDIDALKIVSEGINVVKASHKQMSVLLITHYQRILNYINPDKVYVMLHGKIVMEGGNELVKELEAKGYDWVKEKVEPKVRLKII